MDPSIDIGSEQYRIAAQSIWGGDGDPIPVWLDCDTGHDDAVAVLLCCTCPRLKLLGISTVHGNASVQNTTRNTLSVLEAIGRRDVPVYPGSIKPFCRAAAHAESIHGESGLDGTTVLPKPVAQPKTHPHGAMGAMYEALSAHPGKAWLITTGTLTNAALLFAVYPSLAQSLAGMSIMGGAIGGFFSHAPLGKLSERLNYSRQLHHGFPSGLPDDSDMTMAQVAKHFKELGILAGNEDMADEKVQLLLSQARQSFGNWSPYAEFNIYCDPEAASAIFSNHILAAKTTLIPLDLTHQVLATPTVLQLLKHGSLTDTSPPSTPRLLFHEILTYFAATYAREFSMTSGPPLHDPLAVAAVLAPALFNDAGGERFEVHVVHEGDSNVMGGQRHAGEAAGQCGRTVAKMLERGCAGVRIPRTVEEGVFWHLVNMGLSVADVAMKTG